MIDLGRKIMRLGLGACLQGVLDDANAVSVPGWPHMWVVVSYERKMVSRNSTSNWYAAFLNNKMQ